MSIAIEEDHLALLDSVRRFTADRCTPAVARAAMDAEADAWPPFWDALGGLGWLGLAVPEADGGEGYGFAELVVVLEELGRSIAPGPVLPTVWAAAVLPPGSPRLADLATGRAVGTVALGGDLTLGGKGLGDGATATGSVGPVLCGAIADVIVVPVAAAGAERWCVVSGADVTVTPLESLDATRRLAQLELVDAPVCPAARAHPRSGRAGRRGAGRRRVRGRRGMVRRHRLGVRQGPAAVRSSHRAVPGREAPVCRHARAPRAGAGRGLGRRRCPGRAMARMAARLRRSSRAALSVAAAGAVAFDGFAAVAKDCIQVLGGIGFTWEHDAHLYLRRALALRQLFGGPSPWRQATARLALEGVRRQLTLELPAEADTLRDEVRAVVEVVAALPKDDRRTALANAGLIVPHWAPPWGRDAGAVEQLVIDEELRRAQVRVPHLQVGAWAAPTIAVHGTIEQQERWVRSHAARRDRLVPAVQRARGRVRPRIGDHRGDQGRRRVAAQRPEGVDLDGQGGRLGHLPGPHEPDGAEARRHLVLHRRHGHPRPRHPAAAGADRVWPCSTRSSSTTCSSPTTASSGEVDGGWPLARTTLANERVSMGSGSSFGGGIEALMGLVAERLASGALTADALLLDELGRLVAEAHSLAVMGLRTTVRSVTGAAPGSEASVRKLLGVEHDQRTQELGLALLGPEGATTIGAAAQWTFGFLANRCLTIAGGTSEIQRNVIGERLLGLPRDPEPAG